MSLTTLFLIAVGVGLYRLGAFNERHPGEVRELLGHITLWVWRSFQRGKR